MLAAPAKVSRMLGHVARAKYHLPCLPRDISLYYTPCFILNIFTGIYLLHNEDNEIVISAIVAKGADARQQRELLLMANIASLY